MFAPDQSFAVVFNRDRSAGPAQPGEKVGDGRAQCQRNRFSVGGDGYQEFDAAASLAAAFFCALYARTLRRLAGSTMSATDP